ncbi:D-isomer specific 2-hydroxyacid dehydrogenase family protein [Herbiconiux sp. UC225_62]|uniref:D-isomer specific 2-hydroxyacid dehydrogenase family protein n=1 Tax=Herbiconiux sp. UC225_62 TaxID=3350168 RepID=UPI0036D262C1
MPRPTYTSRHREVLAVPAEPLPAAERPKPGPVAVLPVAEPIFVQAIEDAGGTVEPLGADTRGIVWLTSDGADDFARALEANPQVQWVQLPWAGVDAFADVIRTHDRPDLVWTSAKGAFAQPVAEHALMLTLALLRDLPDRIHATTWGEKTGWSLYGLHVVVIGAGGIALELLRLLEPFGVESTVVRRSDRAVAAAGRTVTTDRLDEVLAEADVVVVAAALTTGTEKLLGAAQFERMKRTAYLVNIARGGLVDTDALVAALAAGEIAGAGLDVTDPEPLHDGHPLWSEPHAIITPHTADTPEMTAPLLAARVRHNVRALLGDGDFAGRVDPAAGY